MLWTRPAGHMNGYFKRNISVCVFLSAFLVLWFSQGDQLRRVSHISMHQSGFINIWLSNVKLEQTKQIWWTVDCDGFLLQLMHTLLPNLFLFFRLIEHVIRHIVLFISVKCEYKLALVNIVHLIIMRQCSQNIYIFLSIQLGELKLWYSGMWQ